MTKLDEDMERYNKLAEHMIQIDHEGRRIWEEKLNLFIRPKRWWMPKRVWAELLDFLLFQTTERLR